MNLDRELKRYVRQIRPGLIGATSNPNLNLNQLVDELKLSTHLREELTPKLLDFLLTRDYVTALTETGLTMASGVFSEVFRRIEYNLLPKPVENNNILSFLTRLFDSQADAEWLEQVDRERFSELLRLLLPERGTLVESLAPQFFMSLEILSLRLASLGYDPVVADRLRSRRDYQTAFMNVPRFVHAMLDGKGEEAIPLIREAMLQCKEAAVWIRSKRSSEGISLALTYRLMKIQQVIRRMELVLELIESVLGEWREKPAIDLFFEILLTEIQRFHIRSFIAENVELLAFQITEHTGRAGEHYITRTRAEWRQMFQSASLGGAVIAGLAVIKILLSHLHLPPVPETILYGLLYSSGFLLIHTIGGTLATKQPAMTASRLAASLDSAQNSQEAMQNLSEVVVRTIRSQLAAVFGNFLIALPAAILICLPFVYVGLPIMSADKARAMMDSFHPFTSLSFFYAGIAGVGLFLSGLLAGLMDNWFVFNNIGSRLKHSELLKKYVTRENLDRTIPTIDQNIGFWMGNIALGFYLAAMGPLGQVLGLPIDVRHITFSSAQLGSAVATLNFNVGIGFVLLLVGSIFVMGLINLGVSFSLSLYLAIRSRRIRFSQTSQLLSLLGRHFRYRPFEFIYPVKDPE